MKICMICPEIGNSRGSAFIGGHVNNVVRLSKALSERGHNITILTTPHRHPGILNGNCIDWAEVICLPIDGKYPSAQYGLEFAYKAILKLKKINKVHNFDIIHGHSGFPTLGLITSICSEVTGIPSVHSIYSPIKPVISRNAIMTFSNNIFSNICLSQIKVIIAVSGNIYNSLIDAGVSRSKLEIIPPFIDLKIYNPSNHMTNDESNIYIKTNQTTILYVGNLTEIKGIKVLIKSLKNVKEKYPNIRLLIALNMPLDQYNAQNPAGLYDNENNFSVKNMIKSYNLEEIVHPIGIVNNLPQIMSSSNIFVIPFLNTVGVVDYPISLLEAMACGVPVISTNVGGISEIITHKENGLLIEPNNVAELEEALIYMLEKVDEAKTMGKNAANYMAEKYYNQANIKRFEEIYEKLS